MRQFHSAHCHTICRSIFGRVFTHLLAFTSHKSSHTTRGSALCYPSTSAGVLLRSPSKDKMAND